MLQKGEYLSKVEPSTSTSLDSTVTTTRKSRKNKNSNKRRFSDEQIRSMETMFESESKLELRTKIQLAKELDLQPRQVAIWFQNRRARWKSKQLERDYNLLKADYDALASQFESIKKEKQILLRQLQNLKPKEESRSSGTDSESDNLVTAKYDEPEQKPDLSFEDTKNKHNMYLGEGEETDFMSVMDPANPMLSWSTFESDNTVFDQSCSTSQWWEIWS